MRGPINLLPVVAFALLISSCGSPDDKATSGKYADSLSELISETLEGTGEGAVSDIERPILEKAVQTGHIEQADYEDAKQAEITCLKNYGYELEIINHASGVIELQPGPNDIGLYSAEREGEILWECAKNTVALTSLYQMQQGNPKLYTNPHQAMVECLEDSGLLQTGDYTAEELADKLKTRNAFRDLPFNVNEPGPQNCFYSAGLAIKVDY